MVSEKKVSGEVARLFRKPGAVLPTCCQSPHINSFICGMLWLLCGIHHLPPFTYSRKENPWNASIWGISQHDPLKHRHPEAPSNPTWKITPKTYLQICFLGLGRWFHGVKKVSHVFFAKKTVSKTSPHEKKIKLKSWNPFLGGGTSNIFYFHPDPWGKWSNLTNLFQRGWNHHLESLPSEMCKYCGFRGSVAMVTGIGHFRPVWHWSAGATWERVTHMHLTLPWIWLVSDFLRILPL